MKKYQALLIVGFFILSLGFHTSYAMEIVFGRKYPIAQKTALDQLNWLSVEFEKDLTGKVIYKLEATHPQGTKIIYLKGKDYLLSEDIQKNMIRNFEMKTPEVFFDDSKKALIQISLPYDFQTRYLPLRFEKPDGYQEIVLRLRFGDYRFMLASRVLNTVSFVETEPVIAAKPLDQLFMKRSQLKKRAPKPKVEETLANVQVDDIYNDIKDDLNIESRIGIADDKAGESTDQIMDDFDALLNKYAAVEDQNNVALNNEVINSADKPSKLENGSSDSSEVDYNAYLDQLVNEDQSAEFKADATIEEIIAQAGNLEQFENETNGVGSLNSQLDSGVSESLSDADVLNENPVIGVSKSVKPKKYIPPVDTEALFGFVADNWVEPKSAPVLVFKPKPIDQKRRIASFEPPKRNNFVEMVPSKDPTASAGIDMDGLFAPENKSGVNSSGFGF